MESAPAQFWADFAACFEQARTAGATYELMDVVRVLVTTFIPKTLLGVAVTNYAYRIVLAEQALILAAMTFASRDQIDNYIGLVRRNFSAAQDVAADNMDNVAYVAIIALQSAVVNDLLTRAMSLPQIVGVTFPVRMPALTIAQNLYQDPSQVAALVAMNNIVHPVVLSRIIEGIVDCLINRSSRRLSPMATRMPIGSRLRFGPK